MENQKRLSGIQFLQMLGMTLLLLTFGIWQIWGCKKASFIVYLAGVFALYGASMLSIWKKTTGRQLQWNTILLIFLEGISGAYLYSNIAEVQKTIGEQAALVLIVPLAAVAVIQISQLLLAGHFKLPTRSTVLRGLLLSGLCIVFAFVLNLECFNTWTHWDSHDYFRAIEGLSAQNIFRSGSNGLVLCGHISFSYGLWSLLFKSIPGLTCLNAIYLSNMVLIAADFLLFFLLFRRLLCGKGFLCHTVSAAAAMVAPWIFGSVSDINAEHLIMTGALLLLYAVFCENDTLSVLAVFVLCGAREFGGAVAAAIIFLQLVHSIYRRKKDKTAKFNWAYYLLCLSVGCAWLARILGTRWMVVNTEEYKRALDGSMWNRFGFYWPHISGVLSQTFLGNFRWIFTALILATVICFVIRRVLKKAKPVPPFLKYLYALISVAFFVYVAEQCAYITFNLPRYYTLSAALLSVLAICALHYLIEGLRWKKLAGSCAAGALAVVLLTQSYITIDPVTMAINSTMQTGKSVIAATFQPEMYHVNPSFCESCAYNRQEMYYLKALDKAYAQIDAYSDGFQNVRVLSSNEHVTRTKTEFSLFIIWGYGYNLVDPPMYGHWNREGGYRYLSYERPEYSIDPIYVGADTDLSRYLDAGNAIFYIEMPWWDTVIGPLREKYPNTELYSTVEHMGWVLRIYKIQ